MVLTDDDDEEIGGLVANVDRLLLDVNGEDFGKADEELDDDPDQKLEDELEKFWNAIRGSAADRKTN